MDEKPRKESKKWMRGLTEKQIDKVIATGYKQITFHCSMPKLVVCCIYGETEAAVGTAICSILDKQKFSMKFGKRKALRQALLALENKKSTNEVRYSQEQFPRKWKKSQVNRVIEISKTIAFKSRYVPISGSGGQVPECLTPCMPA
ncbi:MAG TPA: hypothetical protein VMW95_00735 [Desulfobacterales bacterium]|nr:hypothetical protein [Desulfobacterales bacterium]